MALKVNEQLIGFSPKAGKNFHAAKYSQIRPFTFVTALNAHLIVVIIVWTSEEVTEMSRYRYAVKVVASTFDLEPPGSPCSSGWNEWKSKNA